MTDTLPYDYVPVPGTGSHISVQRREVRLPTESEPHTLVVPGRVPFHLRETLEENRLGRHWLGRYSWPGIDPAGTVFLGRAVEKLGRQEFGDEWLNTEPAVNLSIDPFPSYNFSKYGWRDPRNDTVAAEVRRYLEQAAPDKMGDKTLRYVTLEQWELAQSMRNEALAYLNGSRARLAVMVQMLQSLFVTKRIECLLAPVEGGGVGSARDPQEWVAPDNTVICRIVSCRMSPDNPMDPAGGSHWIFVDEGGLNAVLKDATKQKKPVSEDAKPHLTLAHRDAFIRRVKDAVAADPDAQGPSRREELISEGRKFYRLPDKEAEAAYKEALSLVPGHRWSKVGPKTRATKVDASNQVEN